MFPCVRDPKASTIKDLHYLAKSFNKQQFEQIIDCLDKDSLLTNEPSFLSVLASLIYDKDEELSVKLFNKMKEMNYEMNSSLYNYFLWNAAHFNNN